jgi:predicted N-formylglutamate amidohydrolase
MSALSNQSGEATPLLSPADPSPAEVIDGSSESEVMLICDHASAALPQSLGTLGLDDCEMERHIAIDIGAAPLTRTLAEHFKATAVLAGYSRLLIDCNREVDDHTSIREISEGTIIPGNRRLPSVDRAARIEAIFHPYHAAIRDCLQSLQRNGLRPAVVAMHTFTPSFHGIDRPWEVGILSGRDRRIADPLIAALEAESLTVGDNQPYSAMAFAGYTIEAHAMAAGLANVMIEVRQDLVADDDGVRQWTDTLCRVLEPILSDANLFASKQAGAREA